MTEIIPPLMVTYDGEALLPPTPRWAAMWAHHLVVGEQYLMVEQRDRSANSHRHYFANLYDLWQNLPEIYADVPWAQTSEHLRKYALIKTGHGLGTAFACSSKAEALRLAAFLRPVNEFAVVSVKEASVYLTVAASQSMKAMGGPEFQKSKTDVLEFIEDLIGARATDAPKSAQG